MSGQRKPDQGGQPPSQAPGAQGNPGAQRQM
jgi:hypothetical protein